MNERFIILQDILDKSIDNKKIIENITNITISDNYEELIFKPLGLSQTYLFKNLAYYSPEKDLSIVGTVNQVAFPGTSFRLAIKLIQKTLS